MRLLCFSSCCCRGEVPNGYPKTQTGCLYKWKFQKVAQLYLKVPGILIQKVPLQGRTDVFKLYPSFGKNCNHHGLFIPQRTLSRVLCIGKCTFSHFCVSSLNTGKTVDCGTYFGRHFLSNNSLTFSWVLVYF